MSVELLSVKQMSQADRLMMGRGISGFALMKTAGEAVAAVIKRDWTKRRVLVLCGPGNNGGDGFVVAELLREAGWPVTLACLVTPAQLTGDAALAAEHWQGPVLALSGLNLSGIGLVVDALLGAGLNRPVAGIVADLANLVNCAGLPVVAVDMPTGVNGDTGEVMGRSFKAHSCVTFFRKKPGHLLYPGRACCGRLIVAQIGIRADVLEDIQPVLFENSPALWKGVAPRPDELCHKYKRGSALVFSGGAYESGAARLGARAALRVGTGLVTMACPPEALAVNAAHLDEIMLLKCEGTSCIENISLVKKITAALIGPACGVGSATRQKVQALMAQPFSIVLDADALTSFEGETNILLDGLTAEDVLTPHEGEFNRVFVDVLAVSENRLTAARLAAKTAGAVVVLKGADTVIAAPDGRAAINANGVPWLATAGSGDVLAGLVVGLLAQSMPAFEAACMAVWLHAEAGQTLGAGLIAGDLIEQMPALLNDLLLS